MMHDYAIFGHSRSSIGRWLGVASVVITGFATSILLWLGEVSDIQQFSTAVLTPAFAYFCLHYIFNKWAWKIPLFKIPDLSGVWKVDGKTLNEDGSVKYPWNAEIDIEQTWEKISINLKTTQSKSHSYTATLTKNSGTTGGWTLHYSYSNNPNLDQHHELHSHKGYCELNFSKKLETAEASYFNSNGRRTFGQMFLCKESA